MHIRTRRSFRCLPSAWAMKADTRYQTQPSSAQQLCAAHPAGTPAASTAFVRGCAVGESRDEGAVSSKHPIGITIRTSPLTENLWGARASRSLLICCANCTWLFLSCEINSQRGKRFAQNANLREAGAHVQHLPFVRQCPATRWPRQRPQTRARPPYLHHADKPSVREPAQAAASTRSFALAPRPAEAQLPSRTAPGNTTTRQRLRPNHPPPAWAAPLWPGPSRHAPLAAWPLSPPAAPRPAPPFLAGGWGAAAEAMAAEAGGGEPPRAPGPPGPPHRPARGATAPEAAPPVPVCPSRGRWQGGVAVSDYQRWQILSLPSVFSTSPFQPWMGSVVLLLPHSFSLLTPFWFQKALKK